ncbi:MAG: transporter substrate-binding domain-containing protein [Pseudomonadota bacterium]
MARGIGQSQERAASPALALLAAHMALAFALWTAQGALAQTGSEEPSNSLRIGAPDRAPFAMQDETGAWQGIGVDLWRMVAEDLQLSYAIVPTDIDNALAALQSGDIDIMLALDATPEGEASANFLTPFYAATLGIAGERRAGIWGVIENLFSIEFLEVVAYLSGLLLSVGAVVWLLERRRNARQFHPRPLAGLGDGFWWAGVTLTTIGYGDKAPITAAGRAVAMVWMLVGLAVSAALTATVVSAANVKGAFEFPRDLQGERVAVVEGSSAALYLARHAIAPTPYATIAEAVGAVDNGEAQAVAAGAAELYAATSERRHRLLVTRTPRDPHYIAIALTTDTDAALRDDLQRAVLERITSDGWWALVNRYVPDDDR